MKPIDPKYIYYDLFHDGHPYVTICLMRSSGVITRGMSICSDRENFNRKDGKMKARGRAEWAFGRFLRVMRKSLPVPLTPSEKQALRRYRDREQLMVNRPDAFAILRRVGCEFRKKAYPVPVFTNFEVNLMMRVWGVAWIRSPAEPIILRIEQ
ncbi:hypothetical protein KAR91_80790 [Candidatus Pacearchaeota archaeon]|nr:hypothetical protein [Candidatus Pacearchaeota archaeon]